MYRVPLSQLSPFLCTERLYADTGHKKWGWQQGPPLRLKTIKSKPEIGRCLAVTDNSGTNAGNCKFPLLTTPLPTNTERWGPWETHTRTHTRTGTYTHTRARSFMLRIEDKLEQKRRTGLGSKSCIRMKTREQQGHFGSIFIFQPFHNKPPCSISTFKHLRVKLFLFPPVANAVIIPGMQDISNHHPSSAHDKLLVIRET